MGASIFDDLPSRAPALHFAAMFRSSTVAPVWSPCLERRAFASSCEQGCTFAGLGPAFFGSTLSPLLQVCYLKSIVQATAHIRRGRRTFAACMRLLGNLEGVWKNK